MELTRLDVMVAGVATAPAAYIFRPEGGNPISRAGALLRPGGESVRTPFLAFAVHHPTAGPIVIDTGLHRDTIENLRSDFGPVLYAVFRSLKPSGETFDEQLRGVGVEPGDVKLTVMTHLHADHTSGMRLLPETEFVCAREEWKAATGRSPTLGGYVSKHLPPASRMRLLDFARDGEPYEPFSRSIDLLGDGSIRLLSTPGHTPGHMSVLLRLEGGRQVLVIGDAAYTLRSVREQILSLRTVDDDLYRRSLAEIKAFADANPDATLVPTHDENAWRELEMNADYHRSG